MVTQAEIADRVGLSRIAVSYALRGSTKVSRRTRLEVARVAEQMGYRLNAGARATRTGRSGAVALLLSGGMFTSNLPSGFLGAIEDAVSALDLHLIVARLPGGGSLPKILRERAADGLLVNYTHHIPGKVIRLIRSLRIPAVWINTKRSADCVHPDDLEASRRATERLLGLGHRRIAYVDYSHPRDELADAHYSAADREGGYVRAMAAAGLPPRVVRPRSRLSRDPMTADLRAWLIDPARRDRPSAVVVQSDSSLGPMFVLAAGAGWSLPRDLSVVTFSDTPHLYAGAPAGVMVVPAARVAREAVAMIREKLAAGVVTTGEGTGAARAGGRHRPVAVPHEFAQAEACVPPGARR